MRIVAPPLYQVTSPSPLTHIFKFQIWNVKDARPKGSRFFSFPAVIVSRDNVLYTGDQEGLFELVILN
jgi:hypothetical protein